MTDAVTELIERFAAISPTSGDEGVSRLAYTDLEREAHAVFAEHMRRLGLRVWTEASGNTIAELEGTEDLAALGTGSHLDSVPNGGRFDGIAGVVAAMLTAEQIVESGTRPRHPLRFVVFAAEEGARFGQACTGSRVAAGLSTAADLAEIVDADGLALLDAMRSVGLDVDALDDARWQPQEWRAFIELHIEQGSVLATAGDRIGAVTVISGSSRFAIDLDGRAAHTGGTPMHLRLDASTAAAEIVLAAERLANDDRHRGTRITVGRIDVSPGSITTIPGHARLFVDVRDIDAARQRETADELLAIAHGIAARRGIGFAAERLGDASPAFLPSGIRNVIVEAARARGLDYRVMPSGASHDTQMISRVCAAGMIFVPSQNHGVSHAPEELTIAEDIATGQRVLLDALRSLDAQDGDADAQADR